MEASAVPALPSLLLETYQDLHHDRPPLDLLNKQSTEYLTRLTGYSLNSLTSEPSRIADEHAFVGRELTSLCIGEYKSFVAVHQCKEQVREVLNDFDASLEELCKAIPELERECATFVQETSGIQADRRRAQIVLEHQDKLVDLLDIPQLVDTCVRNGYYHEAMELTAHTRQLVSRHPDVALVHSISAQVTNIMQLQLSQLVASLREPVKLPVLVKSIGFLRKMGSLEEDELRLAFLESRAQCWRDHVKEHVDKERHEPTRYVRRYVDAFRELQYDTVAQYNAIFLDPSTFRSSNHTSTGKPVALDTASRIQAVDLLVRYVHQAVSDLLQCITTHVPSITDPSSLASLLTQLGYTALSFARVGMDFSAHLPEVFEHAVQELTTSGWQSALTNVLDRLKPPSSNLGTGLPSGRPDIDSVLVPGFLVSSELLSTLTRSASQVYTPPVHGPSTSKTVPPLYLTSYPLLATYTNSSLVTLNSLRLLAPVALFPHLYSSLLDNLTAFAQALLGYANSVTGQGDVSSLPAARRRSEGLRRNTSISNRDQLAERTQTQERDGRRVLSTVLDAYTSGCVVFLKAALVEGVYQSRFGSVQDLDSGNQRMENVAKSSEKLKETVKELKNWVGKHAERPSGQEKVLQTGIEEEETANEDVLPTKDSAEVAEVSAARSEDSKQMPNDSNGNEAQVMEPEEIPHSPTVVGEVAQGYQLVPESQTIPESVKSSAAPTTTVDVDASASVVVEKPSSEDAGQTGSAQQVNELSDAKGSTSEAQGPDTASFEPPVASPSTQPNVIEQVLEVAAKAPPPAEDAGEVANDAQAALKQVTEEVQIPITTADAPNLDDAKPVPLIPDTSVYRESAGRDDLSAAGLRAERDATDMLDQLIQAKQVAETAASSMQKSSDVGVNSTNLETSAAAVSDNVSAAHAETLAASRDTATAQDGHFDQTAPTSVPFIDPSEPEPPSTDSHSETISAPNQDQTEARIESSEPNSEQTITDESSTTSSGQETQLHDMDHQGSSRPATPVQPVTSEIPASISPEKLVIGQTTTTKLGIFAETSGNVEELPTQVAGPVDVSAEADDSSRPTPLGLDTPEDEGKSELVVENVGGKPKKKKNKKKGKK